jgi:hypothetical protein
VQFAAGCVHVPETLEYVTGVAGSIDVTAYPAQFELGEGAATAEAAAPATTAPAIPREISSLRMVNRRPHAVKMTLRTR